MRLSTDRVPVSSALLKDCGIPLALYVNYFGEPADGSGVPTVSYGKNPIVRCNVCRVYINPHIRFIEGGTKWVCSFCGCANRVEEYFYSPLA